MQNILKKIGSKLLQTIIHNKIYKCFLRNGFQMKIERKYVFLFVLMREISNISNVSNKESKF